MGGVRSRGKRLEGLEVSPWGLAALRLNLCRCVGDFELCRHPLLHSREYLLMRGAGSQKHMGTHGINP